MNKPLFLLASGSPRRKKLLADLGLPFEVIPNPWTEVPRKGEPASAQVRRLAREKLVHYLETHPENPIPVLTADTLISFRGKALNKPLDEAEAWQFYRLMAGKRHFVLTSVALGIPKTGKIRQMTVKSSVDFVPWNESLYRRYLSTGEWHDAAGGYKIQETGAMLVRKITGSWTNIVGLPSYEVYGMISATLRFPRN